MDALEALKKPKKPNKQKLVDQALDQIEKKIAEGFTLPEIGEALLPSTSAQTFRNMVTRAREKRLRREAAASSPSGTSADWARPASAHPSGGVSAGAGKEFEYPSAESGPQGHSLTKRSCSDARLSGSHEAAPRGAAGSGRGEGRKPRRKLLSAAEREICELGGKVIEPQDDRIPPPWSDDPVHPSDIPDGVGGIDLPSDELKDSLESSKSWLEVHWRIDRIKANKLGDKVVSPGGEMLANWFGNIQPTAAKKRNKKEHEKEME